MILSVPHSIFWSMNAIVKKYSNNKEISYSAQFFLGREIEHKDTQHGNSRLRGSLLMIIWVS